VPHVVGTFEGACSRQRWRKSTTAWSISSVSTACAKGADGMNLPCPFGVLSATSPNLFIPRIPPGERGEKQTRLGNVNSVKEELAPHVHDITRALGNKGREQEIERELSSYVNVYRVSLDTAKRSIVKKHCGSPATLATGISKTLRELMPGEQSGDLPARIASVT